MIQQRKKDYLQRLIDEFFAKLQGLADDRRYLSNADQKAMLNDCFHFFFTNFGVSKTDSVENIAEKIQNEELFEQYAGLLLRDNEILAENDNRLLLKALSIIEYLEKTNSTFSWERTVLREDILRRLDEIKS